MKLISPRPASASHLIAQLGLGCLLFVLASIQVFAQSDSANEIDPLQPAIQAEEADDPDAWSREIDPEAMLAIPIVFLTPIAIVAIIAFTNRRKRELVHQTIDKIIESGQPLPIPLLEALHRGNNRSSLRSGATNVALGFGGGIALWVIADADVATIALIPLFIGVAQLIISRVERGERNKI